MNEHILKQAWREINIKSDDLLRSAVYFLDSLNLPIPSQAHGLTPSQANGLSNVINCEDNIGTVLTYVQRQGSKSTTRDPAFWNGLKREIEGLRKQADVILQKLDIEQEGRKDQKKIRDDIQLLIARDYVQHLVAHIIYRAAITGGK